MGRWNSYVVKPALSLSRILPGDIPLTVPAVSLVVTNIITVVLAIVQHWDLSTVIFIYWAQSIIIGFYSVITILTTEAASLGISTGTSPIFLKYMWLGKLPV